MAKDDLSRYSRDDYYGKSVTSVEGLNEISSKLDEFITTLRYVSSQFSSSVGQESRRQAKIDNSIKELVSAQQDLVRKFKEGGEKLDGKEILDLFKPVILEVAKHVQSADLTIHKKEGVKKYVDQGFYISRSESKKMMDQFVDFSSSVLTRVPTLRNSNESALLKEVRKTTEEYNDKTFNTLLSIIKETKDLIGTKSHREKVVREEINRSNKAKKADGVNNPNTNIVVVDGAGDANAQTEPKKKGRGYKLGKEPPSEKKKKYLDNKEAQHAENVKKERETSKQASILNKTILSAQHRFEEGIEVADKILNNMIKNTEPLKDFKHAMNRAMLRHAIDEDKTNLIRQTPTGMGILSRLVSGIKEIFEKEPTEENLASHILYSNMQTGAMVDLPFDLRTALKVIDSEFKQDLFSEYYKQNVEALEENTEAVAKISKFAHYKHFPDDHDPMQWLNAHRAKKAAEASANLTTVQEEAQESVKKITKTLKSTEQIIDNQGAVMQRIGAGFRSSVIPRTGYWRSDPVNAPYADSFPPSTTNQIKSNEKFVRTVIYGPSYVPPPHRAYTSTKSATAPQSTTSTAFPTIPFSSTAPYISPIQGQTLSTYAQTLRQQQQNSKQAQWNSILQSALKNLGVRPHSPSAPPSKWERFGSWTSDKIDKGKSLIGGAIGVGNTMAGGSLGELIAGKSVLGRGLLNLSQKATEGGDKVLGKLIGKMAIGVGAIVILLKKMVDSSPMLKAVVDLLNLGITLFFLPIGTAIAKELLPKVQNMINTMIEWNKFFNNWPDSLFEAIDYLIDKLKVDVDEFFSNVRSGFEELPGNLSKWVDETIEMGNGNMMVGLSNRLVSGIENWIQNITDRGGGSFWKGTLTETENSKKYADAVGSLNPFNNILKIFGFYAKGGYVPPRPGGTPIIVGEGGKGEYIVPEGSAIKAMTSSGLGGGGETNISINVSGNIYGVNDLERTIKNAVDDSLNRARYR